MSRGRKSDIRSELRPAAQLLKLTYTASNETAFAKYDRQCIRKHRGKWKSRNTVAEEKAIVREDGSILRILVVRCEDREKEGATGLLWLHDGLIRESGDTDQVMDDYLESLKKKTI